MKKKKKKKKKKKMQIHFFCIKRQPKPRLYIKSKIAKIDSLEFHVLHLPIKIKERTTCS